MKKEMKMMDNGNYEEVICPIQHSCASLCGGVSIRCFQYNYRGKRLFLEIEDGDPYEDGYCKEFEVNYCPFCGYSIK